MSALGQKQTCAPQLVDVRFTPKADMCSAKSHVRFTPESDRESGAPRESMSALHQKADMGEAPSAILSGPKEQVIGGNEQGASVEVAAASAAI
jgi:hypothetical protein